MFYLTNETLPVFIPLGFIGLYRWFWFLIRVIAYFVYKPLQPRKHPRYKPHRDVTIVVPTIDADDNIKKALKSWLKNNPYEVIFVTVPSAKPPIERLIREVDPSGQKVRVITIAKPNKRNQMVAGANHVKTEITVYCDDDVLWPPTMLEWMLAPFEDKQMGGVGTAQKAIPLGKRMTVWEVLAAYRISMRNIEIVSTTYIDGGVCCLSGRTAAYRTRILRDPEWQWSFTHEFWLGKYHQHSGDDKFLTRWLHSHSWKTHIQCCPEAELCSTFKDNWRFLKQLLRWTRNTWRSDMRSLITERHLWSRHPFTAFTMLDKFFNMITLLAGPITVGYLCSRGGELPAWVIIISYILWLLITRLVKYLPHFYRRPWDILYLPIWVVFSYFFAILKIYCLFTLHITDWGTRKGADDQKHDENKEDLDIFTPHWNDPPTMPGQQMSEHQQREEETVANNQARVFIPFSQPPSQQPSAPTYPLPLPLPQSGSLSSMTLNVYSPQNVISSPSPSSTSHPSLSPMMMEQNHGQHRVTGASLNNHGYLPISSPLDNRHVSVNLSVLSGFTVEEEPENQQIRNEIQDDERTRMNTLTH